ncbi:BTB/POZ domain-containing protein [Glomus cerebriforme]|uniref:BTB/POZ domain-containing protein n=1 Tax=Glomus cerebriforme TaxID=658196 RepID=A0A397TG60_9GLOM|nr:BTB/POZ domain-containing protein [Glomus cerebriforme]
MIPNIIYNLLNRNSSNNNSSNNDSNENSNNNNPNNNLNDNSINTQNINNNEHDNGFHSSHSTLLEQQIASQLREQSRQLREQQQQHDEQASSIIPPIPNSTSQSVFTNLRFGQPVCILRAPEDSNFPSTHADQNSSGQLPLSTILLPPNYIPSRENDSNEQTEIAKVSDESRGGLFVDKFPLHVIPVEGKDHLFMNRISYNTQTDAYYENGNLSNKYLKKWKEGAYQWDNIETKIEYDWMKTYLARSPTDDRMNDDGNISWKFDYRVGEYVINSLNIRLSFGTFDNLASVHWFIKPLPTMKNKDPTWQSIQFDPYTESRHEVNEIKDLTQFVKNEYGFILEARLSGGEEDEVIWQKTQLFRQNWNRILARGVDVENDETFGLDVKVELKPDIIMDPLPELSESFVLNDESTSDFIIHYEISSGDNPGAETITSSNNYFYVHSKLLSKRSDYFNALFGSKMVESQSKSLTLTDSDISYESLEIILNYLYKGTLPNIKSFDEWTTLLRYASRFLISTLIQRCEKALKGYLNHDNLSEIEKIANEYGAEQLLQCCKYFEPSRNN